MIEKSIMDYLLANVPIKTKLASKIYYSGVPVGAKLPYVMIRNAGGMRKLMTQAGSDTIVDDTISIYVDSTSQFEAKDIADMIVALLDNYRGNIGLETDAFLRCGSPRDLNGFQGTYRNMVTVYCNYRTPAHNRT
jgi:hypothetical protein